MERLEAEIAMLLRDNRKARGRYITIGSVESATGGRIADRITDIAGSSDYYLGTVVSYSNSMKTSIAGVRAATLKARGAVSMQTACEMADGGRRLLGVDICVSTTGIAGPGGATAGKPIGLFYIGSSSVYKTGAHKYVFPGDREQVKQKATEAALEALKSATIEYIASSEGIRLEEKHVVTCFLEHNRQILLLRRSGRVGTYRKTWAGISGYIETDAIDQAYTEISEEAGLSRWDARLVRSGEPVEVLDLGLRRKWVVHPFLFKIVEPRKIKTDWEHTEHRWINPGTITRYRTVPGLKRTLDAVWL